MQKEPATPAKKTLQHEQEEIELPQLEEAKLTEVSSSIPEEPLDTVLDMNDYNQPTSDRDSSVHEEPTLSVQNNDEQNWNKRTQNLLNGLRKLNRSGVSYFSFQNLCKNNKRKQVSTRFYSFLVLKKQSAIKMTQSAPYDTITVLPGPRFHTL